MPRTMGTVGYPLFRRGSQNLSFLSSLLNHLLWGLRSHAPALTLIQDTAAPKHKAFYCKALLKTLAGPAVLSAGWEKQVAIYFN